MRAFFFCLIMSVAGIYPAAAQVQSLFVNDEDDVQRTFYGGLALGANFTQVDGDGYSGYHKVGLQVGPLVYVRVRGPLFASLELLYSQKGSKERSIGELYASGYDLKLNYVEVPVLLHYNYRRRFSGGLGASYARLISSDESAYDNFPVNLRPDVNYFRKDDLSWVAEVSYEFYRGWLILMRYQYSLRSIRDADRIPPGYGGGFFSGQFNNAFTLRVNYFFHGKARE